MNEIAGAASILPGGVSELDTLRVLSLVNQQHEARWSLDRPLSADTRGSTWAIRDPFGRPAVLKWTLRQWWAPQVLRESRTVAHARARGYPTPAWLVVGATEDGFPYEVQEWVFGAPASRLDAQVAALITAVVASQAGIAPSTNQNWSMYARRVVFENESGLHDAVAGFSEATRRVVSEIDQICAQHRHHRLPDDDLVHGDLSWQNILIDSGRISGIVDAEALGRGTRTIDLVTPLRQAYVLGSDDGARVRLLHAALDVSGASVLRVCAGSDAINILAFGTERWPHRVDTVANSVFAFLEDVASLWSALLAWLRRR